MRRFALSAVGRDRPGIVAAVTRVLLDHGVNIEDSQMAILRGRFAMMLIVAAPQEADTGALRADLAAMCDREGLDALSLDEVMPESAAQEPSPTHLVSVYGADHPGIVHAVSAALAGEGITITDLETRLVGDSQAAGAGERAARPLYVMMLEIVLGPDHDAERLQRSLSQIAAAQEVELVLRRLEQDAL
jgi:glycine cleavage system transcriptional repressor